MKNLFTILLIVSSFSIYSQTDWNPGTKEVTTGTPEQWEVKSQKNNLETPDYVNRWIEQLQTARKNGDVENARELQKKIDNYYGLHETDNSNLPLEKPIGYEVNDPRDMPLGDWYSTDVTVYTGALRSDGYRQLAMVNGDDGNLYILANTTVSNSDTKLFRSTNRGVTWSNIGLVTFGSNYAQSVNISYADSGSVNRITALICYGSNAPPTNNASIWYVSWRTDGTRFQTSLVQAPSAGLGFRNPSIITDGLYFPASSTYFFGTYQQVNSTGTTVSLKVCRSVSFGTSWTTYPAVDTTWNDQFPVCDYTYYTGGAESLYVVSSRVFTATTAGIRVFRQSVYSLGGSWNTNFLTSGNNHRRHSFAVRHSNTSTSYNNQMLLTYAKNDSGKYAYSLNAGASFTIDFFLAFNTENPVNFTNCILDSQAVGNNYAKAVFISNGDSVIYRGGILGSLGNRIKVNGFINSGLVVPTVSSYNEAGNTCGAVAYAGSGPTNVYYDGECLIIGIQPIGNEIPNAYILNQNYPNPFNPVTNINFSIPKSGLVTLTLYDITGKLISTVVDKKLDAGKFNVDFDASNLASGVYFYKIHAGDFTDTKKMMLIK